MNTLKNLISSNDDEEMLKEVRAYQNKLISNKEETPIWERKWLTIEEASAYSGIGRGKASGAIQNGRVSVCNMDGKQNPYREGET